MTSEECAPSAESDRGLPRIGEPFTYREFGVIHDRRDKGLGYALLKTYRHMGPALEAASPPEFFVVHRVVTCSEWMHLGDHERAAEPTLHVTEGYNDWHAQHQHTTVTPPGRGAL